MFEPREGLPIEEQRGTAEDFLDRLAEADGTLIHLRGKKSRLGEDFYICARYGTFGREKIAGPFLIVDMFVKREDGFGPVGYYDWVIKGNVALGNQSWHGLLRADNLPHRRADSLWREPQGFNVSGELFVNLARALDWPKTAKELKEKGVIGDEKQLDEPVYQKYGIGSFLVAVSSYVLQKKGVDKREFISVQNFAKAAWKRFGITDLDKAHATANLKEVTKHPYFKQVVEEFTGLPFVKIE